MTSYGWVAVWLTVSIPLNASNTNNTKQARAAGTGKPSEIRLKEPHTRHGFVDTRQQHYSIGLKNHCLANIACRADIVVAEFKAQSRPHSTSASLRGAGL